MRTLFILFTIIVFANNRSFGQYNANQNKVWVFGTNAGVDFSSGSPVPFTSSINATEGNATVSDASGSLLFYTDGKSVWDKTKTVMPSGVSIFAYSATSCTQATVIVPVLNNANQYYIFSLQDGSPSTPDCAHLAYTKVDMTLNGGLGDVITSSKGIIIDSQLSEKMIVVPGNNCNFWVIVHKQMAAEFRAYEITAAGLSALPVVSSVGAFPSYNLGVIKASPDRKKIVDADYYGRTELFDFDPNTGTVSNSQVINTLTRCYGAEFSPDNSKLYISLCFATTGVYQYDITLPTTAAITASEYLVTTEHPLRGDMKLGPDGKIYIASLSFTALDCINAPNLSGSACNYASAAVSLFPNQVGLGLPNVFWAAASTTITGVTSICVGNAVFLSDATTGGKWSSANSAIATIDSVTGKLTGSAAGTTTISYSLAGCTAGTTVTVNTVPNITGSRRVCLGATANLSNAHPGGTWSSSNTNISISVTGVVTGVATGTATITYLSSAGCYTTITDTVMLCDTGLELSMLNNKGNAVTIFPNPAGSVLNICSAAKITKVTINDPFGKTVYTGQYDTCQVHIDVADLPKGIYFVKVNDITAGRFLKQ